MVGRTWVGRGVVWEQYLEGYDLEGRGRGGNPFGLQGVGLGEGCGGGGVELGGGGRVITLNGWEG